MLYRKLGRTGLEVSILGFGCMRLPLRDGDIRSAADRFSPDKNVDEDAAIRLIRAAVEGGVNYFDTAYPYHNGSSEPILGKAVSGRREKVLIATKLPAWMVNGPEDFDRFLDEQLRRLDTGYVDFYLLHGLGRPTWSKMKDLAALKFLDRAAADGRVRYSGFSFHDDLRTFREIVEAYDWAVCQIQYNYLDRHYQAGREGMEYASSRGMGVVIMEPLRGGRLAEDVPEEVRTLWDSAPGKRSPAEWALRWIWNHREVSTVLSGMNTPAQLEENLRIAGDARPGSLSAEDLALINRVTEKYGTMLTIGCTACAYCMPCPHGVNIPQNFRLYNDLFMFPDREINFIFYNRMLPPEQRAASCAQCGECEEKCPQHLRIAEELRKVDAALAR